MRGSYCILSAIFKKMMPLCSCCNSDLSPLLWMRQMMLTVFFIRSWFVLAVCGRFYWKSGQLPLKSRCKDTVSTCALINFQLSSIVVSGTSSPFWECWGVSLSEGTLLSSHIQQFVEKFFPSLEDDETICNPCLSSWNPGLILFLVVSFEEIQVCYWTSAI